jgi:hypothetical protein
MLHSHAERKLRHHLLFLPWEGGRAAVNTDLYIVSCVLLIPLSIAGSSRQISPL